MSAGTTREGPLKVFKNILVVAFNEQTARALLRRVLPLAQANNASLTLFSSIEVPQDLTQIENASITPRELIASITKHRAEQLDKAARNTLPKGKKVPIKVVTGRIFQEIIREVSNGGYAGLSAVAEIALSLADHETQPPSAVRPRPGRRPTER